MVRTRLRPAKENTIQSNSDDQQVTVKTGDSGEESSAKQVCDNLQGSIEYEWHYVDYGCETVDSLTQLPDRNVTSMPKNVSMTFRQDTSVHRCTGKPNRHDIPLPESRDEESDWSILKRTLQPPQTDHVADSEVSIIYQADDIIDDITSLRKRVGTRSQCDIPVKRAVLVTAVSDADVTDNVVVQGSSTRSSRIQQQETFSLVQRGSLSQEANSFLTASRRGRKPLADNQFKCEHCGASYRQRRNLLKHLGEAHQAREQVVNMYCLVPGCGFGCVHVEQLRRHLKEKHRVPIRSDMITFKSFEEFKTWRYQYQKDNNVSYVISTGKQMNKDGSTVFYYNCSRSGRYKNQTRGDGKVQRSRVVPTQKLGGYCPSTLKVLVYANGNVQCTLWPVHFFHDLGSAHIQNLRLQQQDRELIADRLRQGKCSTEIIDEFSRNMNPVNPTRLNFLCRKDIVNVRLAYSLPPSPTIYNRGRPRKNQWPPSISSSGQMTSCSLGQNAMETESGKSTCSSGDPDITSSQPTSQRYILVTSSSRDQELYGETVCEEESKGSYCVTEDGQQVDLSETLMRQLPDGTLIPINISELSAEDQYIFRLPCTSHPSQQDSSSVDMVKESSN